MSRGELRRALLVSVVVLSAVALPGLRMMADREASDGFPLSTYPMFTEDPGRVLELPTVVAVSADGVERLSPQQIAGTDQIVQAWETVRLAVAGGPAATAELCDEVARRLEPPTALAVVIERYDTLVWASDPTAAPQDRRTVSRCQAHR